MLLKLRQIACVLACLCSVNGYAGVDTGVYACVAHRVVGIQGEGEKHYHGQIELPPEEKLFILTIEKKDISNEEACVSREAYERYLASKYGNKSKSKYVVMLESAISDYQYWMHCGTKYQASFSDEKHSLFPLVSESGFVFRSSSLDTLSLGSRFEGGKSNSLTYTFFYYHPDSTGGSGNYLETGICQKK